MYYLKQCFKYIFLLIITISCYPKALIYKQFNPTSEKIIGNNGIDRKLTDNEWKEDLDFLHDNIEEAL